MPRQDVHDSALTINRERNLGREFPAGQGKQVSGYRFVKLGMARPDHPVEIAAVPAQHEIDRCPQRLRETQNRGQLQIGDASVLEF